MFLIVDLLVVFIHDASFNGNRNYRFTSYVEKGSSTTVASTCPFDVSI